MFKNVVFRILAGLVLLAAIAGIAYFAFTAGVATNIQLPAAQAESVHPYPFVGYGWHMFPFGPGCFAPLLVLFLLCLAFGSMRRMVWGPRWGGHHMHRHGPWSGKDCGEFVPPMFNEWHHQAHAAPEDEKPADEKAAKK